MVVSRLIVRILSYLFLVRPIYEINFLCQAATSRPFYVWDVTDNNFTEKTIEISDYFPPKVGFHSNSQAKQDVMVLSFSDDLEHGYYVDLAANDYKRFSNTYVLDLFNYWKGVCIEANPQYYENILGFRSCQLYGNPVGSTPGERVEFLFTPPEKDGTEGGIVSVDFDNKPNEGVSTTTLYTATLESILYHAKAPSKIDYLSLDIEGAEYYAMKSFNFSLYSFSLITCERPNHHLHVLFSEAGYRYLYVLSGFGEVVYIHHTHKKFEWLMANKASKAMQDWFGKPHNYLNNPPHSLTFEPWKSGHSKDLKDLEKK